MSLCNYFKRNRNTNTNNEINENLTHNIINEEKEEKEKEEDGEKYIEFNVDKEFTNNSCIICLGTINLYENVIMINCGHKYHKECTLKWFEKNKICPECDFKL